MCTNAGVRLTHASSASRQKSTAYPTRVAIDDWQLHGRNSADAAVEVNSETQPAMQQVPSGASSPEHASGSDMAAPMVCGVATSGESAPAFVMCQIGPGSAEHLHIVMLLGRPIVAAARCAVARRTYTSARDAPEALARSKADVQRNRKVRPASSGAR